MEKVFERDRGWIGVGGGSAGGLRGTGCGGPAAREQDGWQCSYLLLYWNTIGRYLLGMQAFGWWNMCWWGSVSGLVCVRDFTLQRNGYSLGNSCCYGLHIGRCGYGSPGQK